MSKSSETEELPENQWKDISHTILADLEEVGFEGTQRFPLEELLSRLPRITLFRDVLTIVVSIVLCLGGSFLLMKYDVIPYLLPVERSIDVWASNLLIGLSTGLLSGLMLMWFSNRRERTVSAYATLIKVMRKRHRSLVLAQEKMQRPYFCYFVRHERDVAFQWLRQHVNFILTVIAHYKFLNRYVGEKAKVDVEGVLAKIDAEIKGLRSRWDIDCAMKESDVRKCFSEYYLFEYRLLRFYETWIAHIEVSLYNLKYGKKTVKFEEARK